MTRICWNQYYIEIAEVVSKRSPDPSTKVGAVVVGKDNRIISCGYNGFPSGIDHNKLTLSKQAVQISKDLEATKEHFIVHAELNAILSSKRDLEGSKLYTTLFPCSQCAKAIITSGISEVLFLNKKQKEHYKVSQYLLEQAGIVLTQL